MRSRITIGEVFSIIISLILIAAFFLIIAGGIAYSVVPSFRATINEFQFRRDVVDAETDYTNRKNVEDQARSMIANYNYATQEYNTYKDFVGTDDKARAQRALDSKSSANKTAAAYNEYLTKNNYIFRGNLPNDIPYTLPYLD